jgi:hypothetical protein
MAMRRRLSLAIFSMVLPFAACATGPARYTPPAAEQVHPAWLTGTWQGTAYQVVATRDAAQEVAVTVTFAEGGAWKAMNGASGASWLTGDWVVLDGAFSGGNRIRYTLKERRNADGSHELWGVGEASFGAASVSLKKTR